jgi:hypothetical protein
MYVSKLMRDASGGRREEGVVDNPSWQDIEAAISALDGKLRTVITISDGKIDRTLEWRDY